MCFASQGYLKCHGRTHSAEKQFACAECGKQYSTLYLLKAHVLSQHVGETAYRCNVCKKVMSCIPALQTHMMDIHSTVRPYSCPYCGLTFAREAMLTNHCYVHYSSRYSCKHCTSRFKSLVSYKRHLLEVHDEGTWYSCEICEHKFVYRSNLRRHLAVHSDALPYVCSECSKPLKSKYGLRCHQLWHSGIKQFGCLICNEMFYLKTQVRQHVRCHEKLTVEKQTVLQQWYELFAAFI